MNETKRNEIAKLCESLSQDELIELCKKLIYENEELKSENEDSNLMFWLLATKVVTVLK